MKRIISMLILDFALFLLAFGLVHMLNYGQLQVSTSNSRLFLLLLATTYFVSLASGKHKRLFRAPLRKGIGHLLKSGIAITFLASLLIVGLQMLHVSRTMTYGAIAVFVGLEAMALILYQRRKWAPSQRDREVKEEEISDIHPLLFIFDGIFLAAAFVWVSYFFRGDEPALAPPYCDILPIVLGLWLAVSLVTRKFEKTNFKNYFSALGLSIKTCLIMAAGLAFLVYFLRLGVTSRIMLFGPLVILLATEGIVFWVYSNYRQYREGGEDVEDAAEVQDIIARQKEMSSPDLAPQAHKLVKEPAGEKLQHALEFFDARILNMLKNNVDANSLERSACRLLSADDLFNLEILDNSSMDLILNLHKVNDIRRINRYFLSVHTKLTPGGYFMGKAYTIANHYEDCRKNYPKGLSTLFYTVFFVWGRVFPKLPVLKKIYFGITKGQNRMISRAEILGRLSFCGFKIIDDDEQGQEFFFIARKERHPNPNENPTYGPLVKLKRSGLEGRPIEVYKFRTMYPFSEFLQQYVYENCDLQEGGKFKDDFRVTGWGAFMRRNWLDELPMLYNWLRGEMQLIGVRPLSSQYLALYSDDIRKLRQKVKPGLLPPFYADMPETLDEIMASERRYIESYLQDSMRTQVRYFCRCVWNIVFRKRRSK